MRAAADFRSLELQLLDDLRCLADSAVALEAHAVGARVESTRDAIERRSFRIAVVGHAKRGKSTLVNALLGCEVCATDVALMHDTPIRVRRGPAAQAHLVRFTGAGRHAGIEPLPVAWRSRGLSWWAQADGTAEILVTWPHMTWDEGVELVDTPAMGHEAGLTRIAEAAIAMADLVVLVVAADSPLSESEVSLVEWLLDSGVGGIIVVVNALDRIADPRDAHRVIVDVERRVQARLRTVALRRSPADAAAQRAYLAPLALCETRGISSRRGLVARLSGDDRAWSASGCADLARLLGQLMLEKRSEISLRASTRRARNATHALMSMAQRRQAVALAAKNAQVCEEAAAQRLIRALIRVCRLECELGALEAARYARASAGWLAALAAGDSAVERTAAAAGLRAGDALAKRYEELEDVVAAAKRRAWNIASAVDATLALWGHNGHGTETELAQRVAAAALPALAQWAEIHAPAPARGHTSDGPVQASIVHPLLEFGSTLQCGAHALERAGEHVAAVEARRATDLDLEHRRVSQILESLAIVASRIAEG